MPNFDPKAHLISADGVMPDQACQGADIVSRRAHKLMLNIHDFRKALKYRETDVCFESQTAIRDPF
jgi:hypothetical protein